MFKVTRLNEDILNRGDVAMHKDATLKKVITFMLDKLQTMKKVLTAGLSEVSEEKWDMYDNASKDLLKIILSITRERKMIF